MSLRRTDARIITRERRILVPPAASFIDPAAVTGATAFWDSRSNCAGNQWTDRVGGFLLSQATAGFRPAYSASSATAKNQPSLTTDGSNDFMTSATPISSVVSAAAYTCITVFRPITATTNPATYNCPAVINDGAGGYWGQHLKTADNVTFTAMGYTWGSGDGHADVNLTSTMTAIATKLSAGSLYIRKGSAGSWSAGVPTTSGVIDNLTNALAMGRDISGTNFASFEVCAIWLSNIAQSDANVLAIMQSLENTFVA